MRRITSIAPRLVVSVICLSAISLLMGQTPYLSTEINVQTGTGKFAPLWQTANKQGSSSIAPHSGYLTAGVFQSYNPLHKKISYSYGAEIFISSGLQPIAGLKQAYLEGRLYMVNARVGIKERKGGLHYNELTSGDMGWSGNSRPMPEVSVGILDYWAIPGLKNWLSIKGEVMFAWYIDNLYRKSTIQSPYFYNQNGMMHHSSLSIKIGDGRFPLTLQGSLEHYVQWGGWSSAPYWGTQPHSFKDLLRVMVGGFGSSDSAPKGEDVNSLGNHLGSINAQLDYRFYKDHTFSFYYQYYLDDASLAKFENVPDGVWGFSYRNSRKTWVSGMLIEYIQTTKQSGPIHRWQKDEGINPGSTTAQDDDTNVGGSDDYYVHHLFGGWNHFGMTSGTPFITSPIYNEDGNPQSTNSRTQTVYAALEGYLHQDLYYKLIGSYTKGWGRYQAPYAEPVENTSILVQLTYSPYQIAGWSFTAGYGLDCGTIYGHNHGLNLRIRKVLDLK